MNRALACAALLLARPVFANDPQAQALKNLQAVSVRLKPLSPEARAAGLQPQIVRTHAGELALRKMGLKVGEEKEGTPLVVVLFNVLQVQPGRWAYNVEIILADSCRVSRLSTPVKCILWENAAIGSAESPENMLTGLDGMLAEFENDLLSVR